MGASASRTITIAAALIRDDAGRLLLVRKSGSHWFMQAGGKIEPGETAAAALRRELVEEIGLSLDEARLRPVGRFCAPAANEPGCRVDATVFLIRTDHVPRPAAEIAEAVWVTPDEAMALPLAPLLRDHLLPLLPQLAPCA
ncbi:NUDIX domain-containing protein [Sphingomonas sp.]|uniref:NUDIX hydrolase n=1 Tax=Sphingomonas sp. TaxID=28214 RepID=UPI0028964756|nr:NUDIX domain-containing protein [Sphingomonas sp.]